MRLLDHSAAAPPNACDPIRFRSRGNLKCQPQAKNFLGTMHLAASFHQECPVQECLSSVAGDAASIGLGAAGRAAGTLALDG